MSSAPTDPKSSKGSTKSFASSCCPTWKTAGIAASIGALGLTAWTYYDDPASFLPDAISAVSSTVSSVKSYMPTIDITLRDMACTSLGAGLGVAGSLVAGGVGAWYCPTSDNPKAVKFRDQYNKRASKTKPPVAPLLARSARK